MTFRLIVKIERHRFCRRQNTKKLKTALLFFYFHKNLLHTSRIYNTEYFFKKPVKQNAQIDWGNMKELRTYLVHYQTEGWRNTEYNWTKLMKIKLISKIYHIYSLRVILSVVTCLLNYYCSFKEWVSFFCVHGKWTWVIEAHDKSRELQSGSRKICHCLTQVHFQWMQENKTLIPYIYNIFQHKTFF